MFILEFSLIRHVGAIATHEVPQCFPMDGGRQAAQINNLDVGKKQWLGMFAAKEAAHAYDAMAVHYQEQRALVNFPIDAWRMHEMAAQNKRVASRAEENGLNKTEALLYAHQGTDPLVVHWMTEDPELFTLNKSLLNATRKKKEDRQQEGTENDGINWVILLGESSDAEKASPSGKGAMKIPYPDDYDSDDLYKYCNDFPKDPENSDN